ncbi:MAG: adenine phosphoribosyltransferase, partial [bacterium]|nr:adenine phosphoribosyltransferase [bacterium]
MAVNLKKHIREVPGFPKPGINFKDITTLLRDKKAFNEAVDQLHLQAKKLKVDAIAVVESRGFPFGSALAYKMGVGLILVRKPNKLPAKTIKQTYALEYGADSLEMHADAVKKGQKILIVD